MCTFATRHPRRSAQVDVPLKPRLYRHPHGVCAVDAEYLYPGHAAAHIIEDGGRAAFVDVGTNASVPYLLAALAELGIARAAVDYVLLTHVHLDHAGGAGRLMQELPNAVAVLHPRGAPHMIDPSRLIEGSRAVYGERLEQLYGQLLPIPAARVRVADAGVPPRVRVSHALQPRDRRCAPGRAAQAAGARAGPHRARSRSGPRPGRRHPRRDARAVARSGAPPRLRAQRW